MRILYLCLALFFFALGGIGAFLPILPTVPFLLLSSWFFAKSSPRWNRWFQGTRLYQTHLASYVSNRAMTVRSKLTILLPVSAMLLLSAILVNNTPMRILIGVLIVIKYWYFIFRIQTIPQNSECVTSTDTITGGYADE